MTPLPNSVHSNSRSLIAFITGSTAFISVLPDIVSAHAAERMVILTLPTQDYFLGAVLVIFCTVLLGSFSILTPSFRGHRLMKVPGFHISDITSSTSCLVLAMLTAIGFFGTRDPLTNPLSLAIWTGLWIALPIATVCFGNVWTLLNPWYAPVRMARIRFGLRSSIGISRLGHWPACVGFFAFAWLEIVHVSPSDPAILARYVGLYWLLIFGIAILEGEKWLKKGEAFTVYFDLLSRVAPVSLQEHHNHFQVHVGLPGFQIPAFNRSTPGTVAFITLVLAAVSFDGLSETFWWLAHLGINPLEFPGRSAVVLQNSVGLAEMWILVSALILTAVAAGSVSTRPEQMFSRLRRQALALLPISAGYHIAHYLVALLTGGQYALEVVNDPFHSKWRLLGLPSNWVSFAFLTDPDTVRTIWNVQFGLIVGAHVLAILLSRRIDNEFHAGTARFADVPMALLMVVFTVFGLWLITTPTGT